MTCPVCAAPAVVSVIVLSFERPSLLARALASIAAQTYAQVELIVVDNRSASSAAVAEVVASVPKARLIAANGNLGFTGGMNLGLRVATGTYVYFTEDDVELDPACLERLVEYMDTHPNVGLAGPVMFNLGSGSVRCAGGHFTFGGITRLIVDGVSASDSIPSLPYQTGYLPGAAIAARRSLLALLGGFRDDFFMYLEDVDLCIRVSNTSRPIVVVPDAHVFHCEPVVGAAPALVEFHKQKNLVMLHLLHAPLTTLPEFVLRYGVVGFYRAMRNSSTLRVFCRAWWWVLTHAPVLIAERAGFRRSPWSPGYASLERT